MKEEIQIHFSLSLFIVISCLPVINVSGQPVRGRLANPGYENQPVKSTFFFTGNCKNDIQYYESFPGNNLGLYTVWPTDNRHLEWSVDTANQSFVINDLISSGINVVNMSIWGPRSTDNWANWAPMQTSTYSHDELFNITIGKDILIAPYLESTAASLTGSPEYSFKKCFPGDPLNYDTRIIAFIEDLVNRYILYPDNPLWTDKWARVYDQNGKPRYMVCIIHVASTQTGVTDQTFAEGFDQLADSVYARTGIEVGFTLDILPHHIIIPGEFRANPETTGPYLRLQKSVLAIQCYIPEVFLAMEHEPFITRWKHQFSSRWIHTGIPFIQDISAGYDAHIVFPNSVIYGNNAEWREANRLIVTKLLSQGITFNTWNGYTEGYAGMPTNEYGSGTYLWVNDIFNNYIPNNSIHDIPGKIEAEDWSTMEGVQTDVPADDYEGLYVGWLLEGSRIDYDVNILKEDLYYLDLRVAKLASTPLGSAQILLNGTPYKTISIPGTGDWQNWQTIRTNISLPMGKYRMSLLINTGDWNINWMNFKTDSVEYYHSIPGRIESEDYYDMFGVVSERSTDTDSEVNLGYFETNDWVEYYVDVQQSGTYDVKFRVAQDAGLYDARGELYKGNTMIVDFQAPNTSGWQNWTTITKQVYLTSGKQKLKMLIAKGPFNINWFEFSLPVSTNSSLPAENSFNAYPNPFTDKSNITIQVEEAGNVCFKVYNSTGKELKVIVNSFLYPGTYYYTWYTENYPEGIYYFSLRTLCTIKTIKVIHMK